MSGTPDKLRALVLAFVMVTSVFGGTIAFAGIGAANQAGNLDIRVTEDLTVRADNPGESITLEIDVATDGNAAVTKDYDIDVSSLQAAGVSNFGSATLSATSTDGTVNSVTWDSTDNDVVVNYDDDATANTETISVTIGDTAGTPLYTSGVSPGDSYTVSVVDDAGSFSADQTSSRTIKAADINIGSVTRTGGSTALGNDVQVGVGGLTYDSDGAAVVTANVDGTITNGQPELGNRSLSISGSLTTTAENLIEGDHDLYVASGDLSDGTAASNKDGIQNINAYTVGGLRLELDTAEGEVAGEDTVIYNSQQSVDGTIYRTSANAPTQVVADDRVVDYEVLDPNSNTVTNGDTNTGKFSVSESWDATTTLNDDSDGVDLDTYERLDGLTYQVNVGDGGTPTSGNTAGDTFTTLLDISWEIDGTQASQADVTHDDTVQISGTVQDGAGNPISDYRVTAKLYADNGVAPPQKVGTTTTGGQGSFSFTLRLNDGVQNPNIEAIKGSNGANLGVHLGTHQVDRADAQAGDAGGGGGAATPHPAVHYQTVETQPQDAQISVMADKNAPINFEDTYRVQVLDEDGDPESNTRVLIEGAFDGDAGTTAGATVGGAADDVTVGVDGGGSQTVSVVDNAYLIATEQVDGSGAAEVVAFQATTNGNGWVNFTATSVRSSFTVNATAEETTIDTDVPVEVEVEASAQNGYFDVYSEPDIAGVTTHAVGAADPVNIIDDDVEDSQTGYNENDVTDNAPADYQSIFADSGPEVVEVIPVTDSPANRLTDGVRLGYDVNYDLEGMTAYRVSFELRDQSASLIDPGTGSGDFERMHVTGAGIDAVVTEAGANTLTVASGDNVLDAQYANVDADGANEYAILIRPTEVESENPTIDAEIDVEGEDNVTYSMDANGLDVAQFQVDGSAAQSVDPNTNVNVTAVVEDATQGGVPINNGRVRLSQNGTQLTDFDARTQNTNDGEYSFQSVDVGPRGFDSESDDDGIGESTSSLDFTAYQYADANDDQTLVQREVNKAAVESLPVALDDSLQIEYDAENTSKYSGMDDGNFTLTRGVEYDQIAFTLTDGDGNPVNLTAGLNGNKVNDLNYLAYNTAGAPGTNPELVTVTTMTAAGSTELSVRFDTSASDPGAGYYVISDIDESGAANVSTTSPAFADGDSFVIGSGATDSAPQMFTLNIQTPDRSLATNASETGMFVAADANVETEVAGAAGNNVPHSVSDTDNDGDMIDELANDQTDWSQLNTNTSAIETPTAGANRVYRVNATVTDALGTPLNDSDFTHISVDFDGSVDPTPSPNNVGDNAKFEMVNGQSVAPQSDDGILTLGDAQSAGASSASTNDVVDIQNENGTFQFDIEVESAGDDGMYTPVFEIEAQADASSPVGVTGDPDGKSDASHAPTARNPVVEVYGENGGDLPVADDTDNQILANGITQQLRVEAFPADEDGFTLPDGQQFFFVGPVAETQISTTTQLNASFNTALATEGFSEGQIGFIGEITPTGTGDGVITVVSPGGALILDTDGDPIAFDVLRSNRELSADVTQNVRVNESVSFTFTDASTGESVDDVTVVVESPQGDTTTLLTDVNGTATLNASFVDEEGEYGVSTRRAGFAPLETSFSATGEAAPDVTITGATLDPNEVNDNQTVTHTLTIDATNVSDDGDTDTFTVNFPSAVDSISPNSVSVEDAEGDTVAVTGADTSGNLYEFSVSPDSSVEARDLTATVSVDVTFPDVSANTTESITVSVSDSSFGSDSAGVDVTILNVTEEEGPEPPEVVSGSPATDPDDDGVFEDVNGDGDVTAGDATVLFNAVVDGTIATDDARLDMNGDGDVTAGDATVLFNAVVDGTIP